LKNCPADAIDGGKKMIHIVDQEKCTNCGNCFEVCPAKFDAVKKISGEPVPSHVPEEQRMIIKKSKEK
nr:4Fe-4S dicluster domain-containing protein [Bacteroidota bacterium]